QYYIKRPVGLPGESVLILDADMYTAANEATDITQIRIQRKHEAAQEALWRTVYDSARLPRALQLRRPSGAASEGFVQPWKIRSGEGWRLGSVDEPARRFTFDGAGKRGVIHFDRDANRATSRGYSHFPLTDWLAYDVSDPSYRGSLRPY